MKPVERKSHNFVFKGPTPDIGDLSVERATEDGHPVVWSHFRPTPEELTALNEGGVVKLGIWTGAAMPPVTVVTETEAGQEVRYD